MVCRVDNPNPHKMPPAPPGVYVEVNGKPARPCCMLCYVHDTMRWLRGISPSTSIAWTSTREWKLFGLTILGPVIVTAFFMGYDGGAVKNPADPKCYLVKTMRRGSAGEAVAKDHCWVRSREEARAEHARLSRKYIGWFRRYFLIESKMVQP